MINQDNKTKGILYEDVLVFNKLCLFDGEPHIVLDKGRIESALGNQYQSYECYDQAFASVYKSLIINHGFANGNKRTAVVALYVASRMLNNPLCINDMDLAELTYRIAGEGGSDISVDEICYKVFSYPHASKDFHQIINKDSLAGSFIKSHQWLMQELAK